MNVTIHYVKTSPFMTDAMATAMLRGDRFDPDKYHVVSETTVEDLVYDLDHIDDPDYEMEDPVDHRNQVLEELFSHYNIEDHDAPRSMSVGDVVQLGRLRFYICKGAGWEQVRNLGWIKEMQNA